MKEDQDFMPALSVSRPPVGLCWADRLAIGVALLFALILAIAWNGGMAQDSSIHGLFYGFRVAAVFGFMVWIVLRVIDFVLGGPGRRRASWR
jgi:hypothetical protein